MMIKLDIGDTLRQAIAATDKASVAIAEGVAAGMGEGAKIAASMVSTNYLTGQRLKRRTGNLSRSVEGWLEGKYQAVIGVRENAAVNHYKWILGSGNKTITPKKGKYLAIPIGENLTGAGVARFSSPRQRPDGFFVRAGGQLLFGYKVGKKGKFRALFAMVTSVTIEGSNALYDGTLANLSAFTDAINRNIDVRAR